MATTNAANISTNRAIQRSYIYYKGALALAAKGEDDILLSTYYEGEPGVGKSAVAKALAKLLNFKLVDRRANMLNPDDAAGTRMQDMDTRTTAWFPPDWMPAADGSVAGLNADGKPYEGTILFFDELASADDRVRKPLFGVFLDREINGRKLPNNCIVLAAGNEADTGTMVFELDNATRTRFITIRVIADFSSWESGYAPEASITPTVISMLKQNMHRFCETEDALKKKRELYGNPRSWEHVSKIERAIMQNPKDHEDEEKKAALSDQVAGKVGTELAAEYMGVFQTVSVMANLYDLMKAKPADRGPLWPKSIGQLYALSYSMMAYSTNIEQAKEIIALAKEMPSSTSDLPFQEMRSPILETTLQRLRGFGISSTEIGKHFEAEAKENSEDVFAQGPLINLHRKK